MTSLFFRLCMTFKELLSASDRKFLELFTPSFTRSRQQEDSSVAGAMSKIPTSGSKLPAASRLVKPEPEPEALSKRPREGSLDLETGLEAKKTRIDTLHVPGNGTNLTKSKRKSMMSIAGGKIREHLFPNKSQVLSFQLAADSQSSPSPEVRLVAPASPPRGPKSVRERNLAPQQPGGRPPLRSMTGPTPGRS